MTSMNDCLRQAGRVLGLAVLLTSAVLVLSVELERFWFWFCAPARTLVLICIVVSL